MRHLPLRFVPAVPVLRVASTRRPLGATSARHVRARSVGRSSRSLATADVVRARVGCARRGSWVPAPEDVDHLLRRAGFVATSADIATYAAQPLATTVDHLLDFTGA